MSDESTARDRSRPHDSADSDMFWPKFHNRRRPSQNDERTLKLFSFPRTVNRFGFSGSRSQGNKKAFNIREAVSYQDRIHLSGQMPFPMDEGAVNFPGDIQEAISFIAHRNTQEILGVWGGDDREIDQPGE